MATSAHLNSPADFGEEILQRVSRSFAFTIPQLPPELSRIVTNAYLLCRIADTIEDEESLPLEQKRYFFRQFIEVVAGRSPAEDFAGALHPLLSGRTLSAEKELIRRTPFVIRTTFGFPERQQAVVRRCVTVMSNGMLKFQELKNPHGLKDLSQLDLYCYHVAGVVGEMLTELFCDYSEKIAPFRERLFALAASFGQGLQMTNILKDLWDDRDRGACWLPRDLFTRVGFDLRDLSPARYVEAFGRGLAELIGIARSHLRNALAYTMIMPTPETGIRKFCLWAIGMAVLTLRNINRKRNYTSSREVKISRRKVHSVTLVTRISLRNNYLLEKLFDLLTRGLPPGPSREIHPLP